MTGLGLNAKERAKLITMSAVIIRRDDDGNEIGREDLGVVSYTHRNPLRTISWKVRNSIARYFKKWRRL